MGKKDAFIHRFFLDSSQQALALRTGSNGGRVTSNISYQNWTKQLPRNPLPRNSPDTKYVRTVIYPTHSIGYKLITHYSFSFQHHSLASPNLSPPSSPLLAVKTETSNTSPAGTLRGEVIDVPIRRISQHRGVPVAHLVAHDHSSTRLKTRRRCAPVENSPVHEIHPGLDLRTRAKSPPR